MALDPALMDKFERDWNEALEVYEARTTAARLGDTSVDPFRRTTLDPKVAAGMQSELFGPLSAKWGLLTEGAGRRSAAAPASEPTPPRYFQTRAGVFSLDPFTGQSQKVIDVPETAASVTAAKPRTYSAVVGEDILGKPTRLTMTGDEFQTWLKSAPPELRTNTANSAISQMLGPQDAMAIPGGAGPSVSRTNAMLKRLRFNRSTGEFE